MLIHLQKMWWSTSVLTASCIHDWITQVNRIQSMHDWAVLIYSTPLKHLHTTEKEQSKYLYTHYWNTYIFCSLTTTKCWNTCEICSPPMNISLLKVRKLVNLQPGKQDMRKWQTRRKHLSTTWFLHWLCSQDKERCFEKQSEGKFE